MWQLIFFYSTTNKGKKLYCVLSYGSVFSCVINATLPEKQFFRLLLLFLLCTCINTFTNTQNLQFQRNPMKWLQQHWISDISVNCDRPGECSPKRDCLWWHWLTFREPERKSSSESSELWIVSRCFKSLVVVLIGWRSRDVIGRLSS